MGLNPSDDSEDEGERTGVRAPDGHRLAFDGWGKFC